MSKFSQISCICFYSWVIIFLGIPKTGRAQSQYPNLDFSERNFKHWKLFRGPQQGLEGNRTIQYIDISTDNSSISGNAFQFIYPPTNPNASINDPNTCYAIRRIPQGKPYSVRVGPLSPGGYGNPHGYKAAYTLRVDPERPTLVYRFAFVQQFEHGSSSGNDPMGFGGSPSGAFNNATFWMQTLDAGGEKIAGACGNYRLYPGAASEVEWFQWNKCGDVNSTPWMTDVIDLTPYAGQDITLEFNTMDCYTGHHVAYAYVSPETYADDTISYYCPGTDAVVRGPYGFKTYSWQEVDKHGNPVAGGIEEVKHNAPKIGVDLEGANDLIVSDPVPFTRYACTFTSYSGCSGKIIYEIRPDSIYAAYSWTASDGGCRKALFKDESWVALTERTTVSAWKWSFKDPGSGILNKSNVQNPEHIFSKPGDFDVQLVAISSFGCRDSVTHTVTIENDPMTVTADFSFAPDACLMTFTDQSVSGGGIPIGSWEWNFGDDSISTDTNPSHVYQQAGDYVVTLTATSEAGCANVVQKTVNVTPEMLEYLIADFAYKPDGCLSFAFEDKSLAPDQMITARRWNFSDPSSNNLNYSDLQNPSHTYSLRNTYSVSLTVSTDKGCNRTVEKAVLVTAPEPYFDINDVCEGKVIPFQAMQDQNISKYSWNFRDDSPLAEGPNVSHVFPVTGEQKTYPVTLTITTTDGCDYVLDKDVVVNVSPYA